MWHDDSAPVFSRLGLQALPAIFHWGPTQGGKVGKKIALSDSAKVRLRGGVGSGARVWFRDSLTLAICTTLLS